jgi:hypothetical protein
MDWFVKVLLLVIAISLVVIAVHPYITLPAVKAQSAEAYPFYIEPGVANLRSPDGTRQVLGKVVIDMRNGNVWGFPTFTQDPYPVSATSSNPPTSHPFLLAKFAFADVAK